MVAALLALFHHTVRLPVPAAGTDRAAIPERAPWTLPRWLGPVALAALVLFLRRPGIWLDPQFFEEDGLFFEQNYHHGWQAIFIPYAGYLHVVLRLVAWTAGFLPLALQPALYNAAAVALCLAVIARIFRPGIRLPHKTLLAVTVLLIPRDLFGEILGNLTNVQWFLALVPVLMLVEETAPAGWRAGWDLVQLGLVGLSGPFVLMSIPLFAVKWVWVARSRWNALCLGTAILCGAVQAWFIHRQPELPMVVPTLGQWLSLLAWKPIGPLFFGRGFSVRFLAPGAAAAVLLGLGVLLVMLNRRQHAWIWPTVVFAAFGGFVLLGTVSRFLRNPAVFLPIDNTDRYFFLPRLLLVWCLLLHLRAHVGWRRSLLWTALTLAALSAAANLACHALPDGRWAEQVAAFERGETDTLRSFPTWKIFLGRPSARGDRYADVLGETPLQVLPPENAARVLIGARTFLQTRPGESSLVYETPAQGRAVAGRYAAAPGTDGAVDFRVCYVPARGGGMQVLWHGRLDPVHVPADGGAHDFEAAIPPQAIGRLILAYQPASGAAPGGGCWADIRFR